jgi:hypothetical protein
MLIETRVLGRKGQPVDNWSVALLLARDAEIRDPSILKWIQAAEWGSFA